MYLVQNYKTQMTRNTFDVFYLHTTEKSTWVLCFNDLSITTKHLKWSIILCYSERYSHKQEKLTTVIEINREGVGI